MRRRHALRTAAAALTAVLAGCAGDDGADGTDAAGSTPTGTPTDTPNTDPTSTPSPTAVDTATPGDSPTPTDPPTATPSPTPTAGGTPPPDVAQVVRVAADLELRFAPETFEVAAGDTVRWTWEAGGHNVRAKSTPDGADWKGTPGGDGKTYDEGYTYEYTFEVPGEYEYVCIPHESAGMTGSFTVTE